MQKTSQSHPIEIGEVHVAHELSAAIGLTFCPGKKQPDALSGNWQRDLNTDLLAIKGWGAVAVVTLMSQEELDAVQVGGISDVCEALGMEWYHVPVKAAGAFDERFNQRWLYASLRLRRHLELKRRVVIHCQSGLGRTATVAGRLLLDMKWDLEAAVAAILKARPGALSSEELASYLKNKTWWEYEGHDDAFLERMLGMLMGGAVGDAFGYAIEFDSLQKIKKKFGPKGLVEPVYVDGKLVVSDDTQMTLFTVEGLKRGVDSFGHWTEETIIKNVREAYLAWLSTQSGSHSYDQDWELARSTALRHKRAPGNTCLSALVAGGNGTIDKPINNSKGCGAAMRTAPIGLLPNSDRNSAQRLGEANGALTHGHYDGWLAAGAVAGLVDRLIKGDSLKISVNTVLDHLKCYPSSEVAKRFGTYPLLALAAELAAKFKSRPIEAIRLLGDGWTGDEALAIAVYSAMSSKSFMDTIRRAANHDGDSDSTASIAGQLYGTWKGVFSIPHTLIRRLDVFDEIMSVVGRWVPSIRSTASATSYSASKASYRQLKGYILNVLKMVHVLHCKGYQRLRISPGVSGSGCYFRVVVTSADNIRSDNGALAVDFGRNTAVYTTGNESNYFGWHDASDDTPEELADKFVERFPEIAEAGMGRDWPYSGWYIEMLCYAERGQIPKAYFDYWYDPPPGTMHVLDPREGDEYLPAPPGGEGPSMNEIDAEFGLEAQNSDFKAESDEEVEDGTALTEEIDSEMDDEEDLLPLSSFDLSNPADRTGALFTFYQHGLEQLIPFTQQIWDQLNEPKGARVGVFAKLAGVNGASKLALRKILEAFYYEASAARDEAAENTTVFIIKDLLIESPEVLLQNLSEYCDALAVATMKVAKKYSKILGGEESVDIAELKLADVIEGPWKSKKSFPKRDRGIE